MVTCGSVLYELGDWAALPARAADPYDGDAAARNLVLLRWVDERVAAVVRLQPGFEHPGDVSQPDHTHRH